MARVMCATSLRCFRGFRLKTAGIVILTFFLMLTTNLYLVNQNEFENVARRDDNNIGTFKQDNQDENVLLVKMQHLKDELKSTRKRILMHKQRLKNKNNNNINVQQDHLENKPKRRLMNADAQERSIPWPITEGTLNQFVRQSNISKVLYQNLFSYPNRNTTSFSCQEMPSNFDTLEIIGSGYTKRVTKAKIRGKYVALKQVNRRGYDATECAQYGIDEEDCYRLANYKVLKELALLEQLKSAHIIQVLGYCLKELKKEDTTLTVTIATEFGEPLTFISLLQMSWEDRLRIAFGITRLLKYLHHSPVGALTIHDFKLEQFVLVNHEIKLADLDDLDDTLTTCRQDNDCGLGDMQHVVPCVNGRCSAYSDRLNVYNAHKLFYSLLPFEAPTSVERLVIELTNNTAQSTLGSDQISNQLLKILDKYQNSKVNLVNKKTSNKTDETIPIHIFTKVLNHDYPGNHDYWCHGTIYAGANSCAFSVRDENEAKYLCNRSPECKAFVMTSQETWTGRTIVFLKNGTTDPVDTYGNTLFIRQVT